MPDPERPTEPRPPATVEEALDRARRHGRTAAAEAALAARALLDAVSLATRGLPSDETQMLAWAAAALDDAARSLGSDAPGARSLLGAVAEALDAEIARWEARAGVDRDARAVLRAYLGLREILWELGLRAPATPPRAAAAPDSPRPAPRPRRSASPPRGFQRIHVEG